MGKQTIPPSEWASGPSSSSAGPEVPAELQEPSGPPQNATVRIPLAEVELEMETWRPLTCAETRIFRKSVNSRQRNVRCVGAPTSHRIGTLRHQEMVDSLRQKKSSSYNSCSTKLTRCDACQASARLSLRQVVRGRLAEPWSGAAVGQRYCKHAHTKGITRFESARHLLVQRGWETSHPWNQERCFRLLVQVSRASDGSDDRS